jgi:hypothetical protein
VRRRICGRINPENSSVIESNRGHEKGRRRILGASGKSSAHRQFLPRAEDVSCLFEADRGNWWAEWVKLRKPNQREDFYHFGEKGVDRIIAPCGQEIANCLISSFGGRMLSERRWRDWRAGPNHINSSPLGQFHSPISEPVEFQGRDSKERYAGDHFSPTLTSL